MSKLAHALLCVLVAASLAPAAVSAQQVTVLRAARLLDVERGELRAPAVVVIEGGRISGVNVENVPAGEVIDLGDVTLLPGFIDAHTHLTGDLEGDFVLRSMQETPADTALRGARNAARTLQAGFTTVRDLGAMAFADAALARAVAQRFVPGPHIVPSGHAIGITGGHCDATGWAPGILELGPEEGVADGSDAVVRAVRYQIKHGARVIKICATAGVLSLDATVGAQQMTDDEMQTAVQEAARHGLKVAAHAHGAEGILTAVRAGVASIEHGSVLTDEAIALMKARGTYLVPTAHLLTAIDLDALPPPMAAKAREVIPQAKESHRRAIAAGVKVAFGTDAAVSPHGDNAREFAAYIAYGMSPLEAIRTATTNAADLLGLPDRGRLAPGTRADIVAVPGNPLTDSRQLENVVFVMQDGAVVKR